MNENNFKKYTFGEQNIVGAMETIHSGLQNK